MKLKGKLIMSAAALAACAATLTSTTYAWYTANTQVSADGVTGTTAASGSKLLLISDTGKDGSWSNTLTLASKETDPGNVNINGVNLMPVAHAANGEYKGWSGNAVSTSAASSDDYLQFDLFFKATEALSVYVNGFTITNTKANALPSKDILANAGGLTASDTNKTYTVDVRRALKVETKSEVVTNGEPSTTTYGQYNLSKLNSYEDSLKTSEYNAHEYFNEVTGNTIETNVTTTQSVASTEIKSTGKTQWTLGTTPLATEAGEATYLKVTFIVYLDGWDKACFDACQGQSISIALKFTCDAAATGMLYTA